MVDSNSKANPKFTQWLSRSWKVVVLCLGALVLVIAQFWILINLKRLKVSLPPRVVATKELDAYTLIKADDLEFKDGVHWTAKSDDPKVPTVDDLANHYLRIRIVQGAEVRPEMLVSLEEASLLGGAVAMTIPATPVSTVADQLRAGDLIDVQPFLLKVAGTRFEKLLVLKVASKRDAKPDEKAVGEPNVITVAVPTNKSGEFAAATVGATVVVTMKRFPARN